MAFDNVAALTHLNRQRENQKQPFDDKNEEIPPIELNKTNKSKQQIGKNRMTGLFELGKRQLHDGVDFRGRTPKILDAERVHGDNAHAQLQTPL
jgi:hypothetical protein